MTVKEYFQLLLVVVLIVFETLQEGSFYTKQDAEVPENTVLRRWMEISPISCVLHCKQNKDCEMAALTNSECLLLRNATNDAKEANNTLKVTLLKGIDTMEKTSQNDDESKGLQLKCIQQQIHNHKFTNSE